MSGTLPPVKKLLLLVALVLALASLGAALNSKTNSSALGSAHPGGVHLLFADGRTKFVSEGMALSLLALMGQRADGNSLKGYEF